MGPTPATPLEASRTDETQIPGKRSWESHRTVPSQSDHRLWAHIYSNAQTKPIQPQPEANQHGDPLKRELHQANPLNNTALLKPQSRFPVVERVCSNPSLGDKTFNAIGYGGMGLSVAYRTVGADEERLKVVLTAPIVTPWLAVDPHL